MRSQRPDRRIPFATAAAITLAVVAGCGGDRTPAPQGPDRGGDTRPDGTAGADGTSTDDATLSGDAVAIDLGLGCTDGAARCTGDGGGVQCVSGVELPFACSDGWRCVTDRCVAPASCEVGRRSCDRDNVVECVDGATTTFVEACAGGCLNGACAAVCGGDEKSYLGCTFFAVDLDNSAISAFGSGNGADGQQFAVAVSNPGASAVDVTVYPSFAPGAFGPFTVAPGDLVSVPLPRADVNDTSLTRNSYRIAASGPVTAHQFNPETNADVYSNDASLLLPVTGLDREYMVLAWPTEVQQVPLVGPRVFPAFVTIVGAGTGVTRVLVTTPASASVRAGDGVDAIPASTVHRFDLEAGQVVSLMTDPVHDADPTGMRISADQPVSVFVGAECAFVPHNNVYCDHLEEQLLPLSTWGRRYVAPKMLPRGREVDLYRVVAAEDGTTITTTPAQAGAPTGPLRAGVPVEFESASDFVIEATGPILVAQLMVGSGYPGPANGCIRDDDRGLPSTCAIPADSRCGTTSTSSAIGDPALVYLIPSERHRSEHLVLTPAGYHRDALSIVIPDGTTVTLDGAPLAATPTPIAGMGVSVARVEVDDGPHRVSASAPVGLYAYGYDCDVSYAYPGGLNL